MSIEEPRRQPMPPDLPERLRPGARLYREGGSGYALALYVDVVRQVHETHENCFHIEVEFPNVHPKHVEQVLRRQAGEKRFDVAVGHNDEYGVYAIYAGRDGLMDDEVGFAIEPDDGSLALTDE